MNLIETNAKLTNKLDFFLKTKNIPNIIFHGESGSGKRTVLNNFLYEIYNGDKLKIKSNVMTVNCSHGKGIKFIREELKFFAKTNIHSNFDVMFKSIVLLNADSLTIDAQSALRRCIELFSHNTRFFIIVENKHKLLNPILSRFCEIYVSETNVKEGVFLNLHKLRLNFDFNNDNNDGESKIRNKIQKFIEDFSKLSDITLANILVLSKMMYESGLHANNIIDNLYDINIKETIDKELLALYYFKLKPDFRCESMLIFYILKLIFYDMCSNDEIKNMLLI
jgi:hypothetical protein